MTWGHLIFWPITHLVPYWGIFPLRLRFVDLHGFAWSSSVTRYPPSWWFDFIFPWFSDGAFLEAFSQACIFWYCHDSWVELSQMHRLPHPHSSGVQVRSPKHSHWVILHQDRVDPSCYTGAHSPISAVEMIVFSKTCYSPHYSVKGCLFALLATIPMIFFSRWAFSRAWPQGLYHPTIYDSSVDWDCGSYLGGLFSWDSLEDHSFEMTMDSSSITSRVKGIRIVMTLHQTTCFSQMGCETMFTVDLTIPTR